MNIVCTIDNNYIRHCAVMLKSLRNHNFNDSLNVYILHQALEPTERAKLIGYLGSFLPSVSMIQVDPTILANFPVFGHISIATYFRLLIPSLLPPLLKKAIFLDSDIVINGSLDDLWDTPMGGLPIAAVSDRNLEQQRKRLGMSPDSPYFNAGVLLIDLDQWRNEEMLDRGLRFATVNAERLDNWDQDVLNHLFENRVKLLHPRWNAMAHLWGLDPEWLKSQGNLSNADQAAKDNPHVIHFAGGGFAKPWNYHCPHPKKDDYRKLLAQTPWSMSTLEGTPTPTRTDPIHRISQKLKRMLKI
jgi:lipopolysaccharide biosynthesis glycosyltransferase